MRRQRTGFLAFGLVVGVLLGVGLGFLLAPDDNVRKPTTSNESRDPEVEAIDRAVEFAEALASFEGDPETYEASVVRLADTSWRDAASEVANSTAGFLTETYGADVSLEYMPLRFQVVSTSDSAAVVRLWGLTIASDSDRFDESWSIGTVELVRAGPEWLVSGQTSTDGPEPTEAEEVLVEFEEFPVERDQ